MKNIKKWIIILSIIIVILLIVVIYIINFYPSSNNGIKQGDDLVNAEESVDIATNIILAEDYNTFYSIEKNLQNFYLYLKVGNSQAVNDIITGQYLTQNNITQENILNYFPKIETQEYEFLLKQLYLDDSVIYPVYYAYGELLQNQQRQSYYFIIYTDQSTLSWNLEPINKEKYENIITSSCNNNEISIVRNQYNKLSKISVTKEDIAKKYFKDYIYNALYNIEYSYKTLDEEYKNKKYSSLADYQEYIEEKKAQLTSMDIYSIKGVEDFQSEEEYSEYIINLQQKGLKQYSVTQQMEYTQYICIDDYGKYYIFRETAPMQYSVILDTYTIDLPEFIKKYEGATDEDKVLMNIQKFFEAINNSDYKYAYSKLDETYKANNFATQEQFENYIRTNFFEQNALTAENPEKQGDIYLYDITISDSSGENTNSVKKTFVMQLKEGTEFVMSFGLE